MFQTRHSLHEDLINQKGLSVYFSEMKNYERLV